MNEILSKEKIAENIWRMEIAAPDAVRNARPGQFIVLRVGKNGERIPLTMHEFNQGTGVLTVIFQEVGFSTRKLASLKVGEKISDVLGPLGQPAEIRKRIGY